MIRRWFRSPVPEAFLTGGLLLYGAAAFLCHSYHSAGKIFQGVLSAAPCFLLGGLAAFLLVLLVRKTEEKSFLFPLALTAAAIADAMIRFLPAEGCLAAAGLYFLYGAGLLLPAAVLLAVNGTEPVRPMAVGFLLAALACFFRFGAKEAALLSSGMDGEKTIPFLFLLLILAGTVGRTEAGPRKTASGAFLFLLPLPAVLLLLFMPGIRIPTHSAENFSGRQLELTEQVLSLQREGPWENIRFIPCRPCGGFLEQDESTTDGKRGKGCHDLVYVNCRFFPVSDASIRMLSPDGFRQLRSLLTPGGILAVSLPRLEFLTKAEAKCFRSQVRNAAEKVFPHVDCADPPLSLLIASEDPEITLNGDVLAERMDSYSGKARIESPKTVLSVVLPLMIPKKKEIPWEPDAGRKIQKKFLEGKFPPFPFSFRDFPELRYWIFGSFLLLAFAFRYLYAFRPGFRMAAAYFRSGWITVLPLCFLLAGRVNTFHLTPFPVLVMCTLVLSGFILSRPKGDENRWFTLLISALVLSFVMLFPGKQFSCTLLLLLAAFAARCTVPKGTGRVGFTSWFSGAFVCFLLTQMLLAGGCCDPAAGALLLLSLLLP